MGVSVSIGSDVELVVILVLSAIAILATFLLFYGSVAAASGSTKNQGIGLLFGLFLIVSGICLIFYGHPDYEDSKPIRQFGISIICLGLFAYAISFVLYIKKHKKYLQR